MSITFLANVAEEIKTWFAGIGGAILSIFPKVLYFLCTLVFQILDILQLLVRKVAGLDVVYYTTGLVGAEGDAALGAGAETGDIVLRFIQTIFNGSNSILSNVFWAFIILGVIMLVITTFVAVLRSEYAATDAKSASKGKIVGKAFKAIASFAIVPIVCFFGIYLANVILQALDSITTGQSTVQIGTEFSTGNVDENGNEVMDSLSNYFQEYKTQDNKKTYITYNFWGSHGVSDGNVNTKGTAVPTSSTPISGLIFKAASYNANRIRYYDIFRKNLDNEGVNAGVFDKFNGDHDSAANFLDECFANSYTLKTAKTLTAEPFLDDYMFKFGTSSSFISNEAPGTFISFDKNNVSLVWYFYDLWSFNFVIGIGALVVCAQLMIYLVFGLMKRIFELVALFLIAPPITALMPLDDGAALKKWREKFTSKVLGAYGPIVGLNLFFIILPFINSIKFFNIIFLDSIVNLFFVIVGLIMVKDLVGTISELIGAENGLKSGSDMAGEVGGSIAKVGKIAAAPVGLTFKGAKGGVALAKGISKKVSARRNENAMNKAHMDRLSKEDPNEYSRLLAMSGKNRRNALAGLRADMTDEQSSEMLGDYLYEKGSQQKHFKRFTMAGRHANKVDKTAEKLQQQEFKAAKLRGAMAMANGGSLDGAATSWESMNAFQKLGARYKFSRKTSEVDDVGKESELKAKVLSDKRAEAAQKLEAEKLEVKNWQTKKAEAIASGKSGQVEEDWENVHARKVKRLEKQVAKYDQQITNADYNVASRRNAETSLKSEREKADASHAARLNALSERGGIIKKSEAQEVGKEIGAAIKKSMALDSLGPIFQSLGGAMAKGFKDAGGFSGMKNRMQGLSAKEEKIAEELKNQKRILSAQDNASKLLGRGGGGPSTVQLDKATIEALANAIKSKKD